MIFTPKTAVNFLEQYFLFQKLSNHGNVKLFGKTSYINKK